MTDPRDEELEAIRRRSLERARRWAEEIWPEFDDGYAEADGFADGFGEEDWKWTV